MQSFNHVWWGSHKLVTYVLPYITVFIVVVFSTFSSHSYVLASSVPRVDKQTLVENPIPFQSKKGITYHDTDWTLAFDEEFHASSLNTATWNIEDYGTDRYQNCCLKFGSQYFTSQDISLYQNALRITSEKRSMGGMQYTSGAITTENKFSFLYGRVDISARMPIGQGMWPALWMLTGNHDHEINIMEMANDSTIAYQTFHMNIPTYNSYIFQCISKGQDLSAAFHVYSLIWNPTSLAWYIDGAPTCQITQNIPQTPMYLLLDTAVGGSWPGSPDASTIFPQYTDVDYVRIYQAAPSTSCSGLQVTSPLRINSTVAPGETINANVTYKNTCNTPFALNNMIVASRMPAGENADFDGGSGVVTLQPGQSITLNASRRIQSTDPTGQWDVFTSFQTPNGVWHSDGTNLTYFNVT